MGTNVSPRHRSQAGFTLVELLVAMVVLLVGLLGVVQLVMTANAATGKSLRREGSTTLARDVLERSRQVPYGALGSATAGNALRLALGDGATTTRLSATSFAVSTRRTAYTVDVVTCRVDQPSDGTGVHDVTWCDAGDPPPAGTPTPSAADLALGLTLGGVALHAVAGGTVLDEVCAMLGVNPLGRIPRFDQTLGRANGVLSLVAAGATVQLCPGGEQVALDLVPDDATQVTSTVHWTEGTTPRALTQTTVVLNPAGAG